jgi:hypothetical protein
MVVMFCDFLVGKRTLLAYSIAVAFGTGCVSTDRTQIVTVSNERQWQAAVSHATPGSVIEVTGGDYRFDDAPLRIRICATEDAPVLIKAKTRGAVRFTGEYAITIEDSSYVTVDGLTFRNRALKHALPQAPQTDTWLGAMRDELPYCGSIVVLNSDHCRLTRLDIELEERDGFTPTMIEQRLPRIHWINLTGGQHNRIDHCRMRGKVNSGVFIEIGPREQRFRIDHNYFTDKPHGNLNGFEAIRANPGGLGDNMYGMIDSNLFENCDGEGEIISVKGNVLRISRNTFRDNQGSVTVVCGSNIIIDYNYFLNPSGKDKVGGVVNYGNDCKVINNYFGDLTTWGYRSGWGDINKPDFSHEDDPYFKHNLGAFHFIRPQTCRAFIAFNTWANCARFLNLGGYRSYELADAHLPPSDWTLLNNIVICRDDLFIHGEGESGFRWLGNIFWNPQGRTNIGRDLPPTKVRAVDPQLERSSDGLWRLTQGSPAIDNARAWFYHAEIAPGFDVDIDGQRRDFDVKITDPQIQSEFKFDIGADEYCDTPIARRPLTADDVGPDAP